MMTGLFEQSVAFIRSQQEQLASQMSGMTGAMAQPWNVFDPAAMQEMQREYQKRLASFWGGAMPGMAPAPKKAEPPAANDAEELKALRARLEELEKKAAKK
jgi:polyhydroxyalkanoate synthesis regulator protein